MKLEELPFNHSLKNIPLQSRKSYITSAIHSVEHLIRRMRWRAFWFDRNEDDNDQPTDERYGFKTPNTPPPHHLLKDFEDDLFAIVKNVKFRNVKNEFLSSIGKFRQEVGKSSDIIVKADKTRNIYTMSKENYTKLLNENITKEYRKSDNSNTANINRQTKLHAESLLIDDRMEKLAERTAFISIKDHKANFPNNIQCRLINPTRNNLGQVTQQIMRKIVKTIKECTNLNLWMGTHEALKWFNENKQRGTEFIQYDIEAYYPSISEHLVDKAIEFAKTFCPISDNQIAMIKTCRQSVLFGPGKEPWTKTNTNFDVTMGSLDGAETSELIGLFMLNEIKSIITDMNHVSNGLYRDDGLIILKDCPGPKRERIIKNLHKLFKSHGLKITIASTGPISNFLDVTMDITEGTFQPYRKPNDDPVYINANSNHPPAILKHIPEMVQKRLQGIS